MEVFRHGVHGVSAWKIAMVEFDSENATVITPLPNVVGWYVKGVLLMKNHATTTYHVIINKARIFLLVDLQTLLL